MKNTRHTIGMLMTGMALISFTSLAMAATFNVNDIADGLDVNPGDGVCATAIGNCTLRAALMEVNVLPEPVDPHEIILVSGATYQIARPPLNTQPDDDSGDLDIRTSVTITTDGAEPATIDANMVDRAFHVLDTVNRTEVVRLENLNIITGMAMSNASAAHGLVGGGLAINRFGPGISMSHPQVTVENVRFAFNEAVVGGAIHNASSQPLVVIGSALSANTAVDNAAALFSEGPVEIRQSSVYLNSIDNSPLDVDKGIIVNDGSVPAAGGLIIENSTIASNSSSAVLLDSSVLSLGNVTIVNNAGGGLVHSGGDLTMRNTLLSDNALDCLSLVAASSVDINDSNQSITACFGAEMITDPYLSAIDVTPEHPQMIYFTPQSFSPLIDAGMGSTSSCDLLGNTVDQIGNIRPVDGDGGNVQCDVGAIEYQGPIDDGMRTVGPDPECDVVDLNAALAAAGPGPQLWRVMQGLYEDQAIALTDQDLIIEGGYDNCSDDASQVGFSVLSQNTIAERHIAFRSELQAVSFELDRIMMTGGFSGDMSGGGALLLEAIAGDTSTINASLSSVDFTLNSAFRGGAISVRGDVDLDMNQVGMVQNTASTDGGGLYCGASGANPMISITNYASQIQQNNAEFGGGLYAGGCQLNIMGTTSFINNMASQIGGAVYLLGQSQMTVTPDAGFMVRFGSNDSASSGAGIGLVGSNLLLNHTLIDDNEAQFGAAITSTVGSTVELYDSIVENNRAVSSAGLQATTGGRISAFRTVIRGNVSDDTAAAVSAGNTGQVDLISSLVHDNEVIDPNGSILKLTAGGIGNETGIINILHSTLANNMPTGTLIDAVNEGGELIAYGSILDHPVVLSLAGQFFATVSSECNNVTDFSMAALHTQEPMFVDPLQGDFRLALDSPNIDRCSEVFAVVGNTGLLDLDGQARPFDLAAVPNAPDDTFDIGAYEMTQLIPTVGDALFSDGFE